MGIIKLPSNCCYGLNKVTEVEYWAQTAHSRSIRWIPFFPAVPKISPLESLPRLTRGRMVNSSRVSWPNSKTPWRNYWGRLAGWSPILFLLSLDRMTGPHFQALLQLYVALWLNLRQRMWTEVMEATYCLTLEDPHCSFLFFSPSSGGSRRFQGPTGGSTATPWKEPRSWNHPVMTTPVTRNSYAESAWVRNKLFSVKLLDSAVCLFQQLAL